MRKTKFELFKAIYKTLIREFNSIESEPLKQVTESWEVSLKDMDTWLSMDKPPISKSQLAKGLEQGLIEFPFLIENMENKDKQEVTVKFNSVVNHSIPDFWLKIDIKIQSIIKRNKIRNEQEFHLIRTYLDFLELEPDSNKYKKVDDLLTAYEF